MICPKCNEPKLEVTNTYPVGDTGKVQRAVCAGCQAIVTMRVVAVVLDIDPPYGRGAASIAKNLNGDKKTRYRLSSSEGQRACLSDPGNERTIMG